MEGTLHRKKYRFLRTTWKAFYFVLDSLDATRSHEEPLQKVELAEHAKRAALADPDAGA